MSSAFDRYADAATNWRRAAHVCVGLVALFAICRWWFR